MPKQKRKRYIGALPTDAGWYVLADNGWTVLHLPMLSSRSSASENNGSNLNDSVTNLALAGLTVEYKHDRWQYELCFDSKNTGTQRNIQTETKRAVRWHNGTAESLRDGAWRDESLFYQLRSVPLSEIVPSTPLASSIANNAGVVQGAAIIRDPSVRCGFGIGVINSGGFHGVANFHGNQGPGHKFWTYPKDRALGNANWDTHEEPHSFCTNHVYLSGPSKQGVMAFECLGHVSRHDLHESTSIAHTNDDAQNANAKGCLVGKGVGIGAIDADGFHGICGNQDAGYLFCVHPANTSLKGRVWDTHEEPHLFCTNCTYHSGPMKGVATYQCLGHADHGKLKATCTDSGDAVGDIPCSVNVKGCSKEDLASEIANRIPGPLATEQSHNVPDWKLYKSASLSHVPAPKRHSCPSENIALRSASNAGDQEREEPCIVKVSFDVRNSGVLQDVLAICFRSISRLGFSCIKEEPMDVDAEPGCPDADGRVHGIQVMILKEFVRQCPQWSSLDPAIKARAANDWAHLIQLCEIDELRNTHSTVSCTFKNGVHSGSDVAELTRKLVDGTTQVSDLPPLVALKLQQKLFIVCGNRRTRALQDFACQRTSTTPCPKVRVIVHEPPLDQISDPHVRCGFLAKAVLAASTLDEGRRAQFRRRW